MKVNSGHNKVVTITKLKTFHFGLHKNFDNDLNNKIDSLIKHDEFLAENKTNNKNKQLLS